MSWTITKPENCTVVQTINVAIQGRINDTNSSFMTDIKLERLNHPQNNLSTVIKTFQIPELFVSSHFQETVECTFSLSKNIIWYWITNYNFHVFKYMQLNCYLGMF